MSEHVHHWLLETTVASRAAGKCMGCGAEREFSGGIDYSDKHPSIDKRTALTRLTTPEQRREQSMRAGKLGAAARWAKEAV